MPTSTARRRRSTPRPGHELAVVPDTADLDRRIAAARAATRILWRGEEVPLDDVPERIARIPLRELRERLFMAYREALEALNPLYLERLAAWTAEGDVNEKAAASATDPRQLAVDLERFVLHSETPYYAALRRDLALLDIEQGDGTEADLWRVANGAAWAHWFGPREVDRAIAATGRTSGVGGGFEGWRAAESRLGGAGADRSAGTAAVDGAYATIVGSPRWLGEELGVDAEEVPGLVDFVAFVRLWRLRRLIGLLQYELRLFATPDEPALCRAYFAGMVGHITGVLVPEEAFLADVPAPFASVRAIEETILAAQVVDALEHRFGETWWREPAARELTGSIGAATSTEDVLAQLGYDSLDWRPVLRQIRTRLIGEMSGYGGPNITTRAGTRKV
ncbi:MAG TPA: hypothetical protein VHR55_06725 [Candidatus Limnocylindria bacterium]|nr:hypothetical protein [Candidatus Limnocylindria bacterium]